MRKPDAATAETIGFRKAVPPEPARYAQCRNCKHVVYDVSEFMNFRTNKESWRRKNNRCGLHRILVLASSVCDAHEFAYKDRGDR